MYYKHKRNGTTLTEAEYHEMIEKRIKERLADEEEFDNYLHDEYNAIEIFNFTDDDRKRISKQFKEEVRKCVEGYYSCDYRPFEGEPTNTRKICITIKKYCEVTRELPESAFEGEVLQYDAFHELAKEYENNDSTIVSIEDVDTNVMYYEE